MATTIGQTT